MPNQGMIKALGKSGLAGFTLAGDLGDFTWYTNRRGKRVAFLRAPPPNAPSPAQKRQRLRFGLARERWANLTAPQKAELEQAVITLAMVLTGQNLYMSLQLVPRPTVWAQVKALLSPGFPDPAWIPP